jgi:hypothetical protein
MATKLKINDYGMFVEAMKAMTSAVEGIKMIVGKEQSQVLSKNPVARLKMTTNSITSDEDIEFCIADLPSFVKVLQIGQAKLEEKDKITLEIDKGFIKIKSKPYKAKFALVKEEVILNYVDKEFTANLNDKCTFVTTTENIKELRRSAFIFPDSDVARIYLFADDKNKAKIKAELNNRNNPYSNAMTIDFGNIQSGELEGDIILNFDRIDMFTLFDGLKEIEMTLPDIKALTSTQKITSKDGETFVKIWILSSVMAN